MVAGALCIVIGVLVSGWGAAMLAMDIETGSFDAGNIMPLSIGASFCIVGFSLKRSRPLR